MSVSLAIYTDKKGAANKKGKRFVLWRRKHADLIGRSRIYIG